MHQSKLIELLQKLPARQLQRFGTFLQSPYFNKNTENKLLFNYLLPFAPDFQAPGLDKRKVGDALGIAARPLAYRMSELAQLLEQFLLVEQLIAQPMEQQLGLMTLFQEMELPKHYNAALRKARKLAREMSKRVLLCRGAPTLKSFVVCSQSGDEDARFCIGGLVRPDRFEPVDNEMYWLLGAVVAAEKARF